MATGIRCFFAAPQDIKCAMFGTPQSPSLAEEAFAGSINGDCEYLQMQAAFQARRLTRTKVPMPSDGKLSARELMLRVTGIDISMRRKPDLL